MVIYEGKAVFEGIAIGIIYVYTKQEQAVKRYKIDDVEEEKKRYGQAKEKTIEQLKALYDKAVKEVGEHGAEIDRKSTRLNSSHIATSRMPSSA